MVVAANTLQVTGLPGVAFPFVYTSRRSIHALVVALAPYLVHLNRTIEICHKLVLKPLGVSQVDNLPPTTEMPCNDGYDALPKPRRDVGAEEPLVALKPGHDLHHKLFLTWKPVVELGSIDELCWARKHLAPV